MHQTGPARPEAVARPLNQKEEAAGTGEGYPAVLDRAAHLSKRLGRDCGENVAMRLGVETYCRLLNSLLCVSPQWWLLEPPERCLVPPPLQLIPHRLRQGKVKSALEEPSQKGIRPGTTLLPTCEPPDPLWNLFS